MVDPWRAGNFFQGDFIRFGTDAIQSVTQRLVTTVTIEAKPQFDVLPIMASQRNRIRQISNVFYFWIDSTTNSIVSSEDIAPKNNISTRNMLGGSPPPSAFVLTDELGNDKTITVDSITGNLQVVGGIPGTTGIWFIGDYLEMIGSDGQKIYRMTVNSSDVISITLHRTESERVANITISNGHAKPYDDNLGVLFTEALIDIGPISKRLHRTEIGYGGVSVPQIGKLSIQLMDGDFNFLCSQSFDGRTIYVQNGLESDPISSYRVIAYGITNYAEFNSNDISIFFKDGVNLLERELQLNTYAGTGGVEGEPELTGQVKPLAYGRVNHARPILLDYNSQLYQLHDGVIAGNLQIYSGGILRPGSAIQQSLASLLEWVPTASEINSGYYRWHAGSDGGAYFRLANNPLGAITVVFDGDTACSGTASSGANNIANLIRAILQKGAPEFTLDMSNQSELFLELLLFYGLFIDQPITISDILDQILTPSACFLLARRTNGLARIEVLRRKEPKAVIKKDDFFEIGRELSVKNTDIPPRSVRLGYDRTWSVLNESDLLGLADESPSVKNRLQREYSYIEKFNPDSLADPNIKRFTTKTSQTINSLFVVLSGLSTGIHAITEYLISKLYAQNWIYTMTVKGYQFQFDLGDTILLDIDMWDLRNPTPCIIIEIVEESTIGMSDLEQGLTKLVMVG